MNKTLPHVTFILVLIIQLIACQKKPVIIPPGQEEGCQIKQMTYTVYKVTTAPGTATFKYNKVGNPVSVIVSNASQGNPHVLFIYDRYDRLTDYIGTYGNNINPGNLPKEFTYEFWFKYVYPDQNPSSMPVEDTLRVNGLYKDGVFLNNGWRVGNILYDPQGRIRRGRRYDANGNVILDYGNYDNKKNFRRTNKIWMFIDDNYSINNPFNALAYNKAGLPTVFPAPEAPYAYLTDFLYRPMNILTMDYSCSMVQSVY